MSPREITEPITKKVRIIDLFSGMGGIRIGFEQAASNLGIDCQCVFTSDIKPASVKAHKENWPEEQIYGDITKIDPSKIPDFDILLAGFPCQSFSQAGKRKGLNEARGTLFFDIANILREKKPEYFLLENVDNLAKHDGGKTLKIMNNILIKELGYKVNTVILDAIDFGVPQNRKRIYIIGSKNEEVEFENPEKPRSVFSDIMEQGLPTYDSEFTERVLELYEPEQLIGKKFKDKRGGSDNIHSWDLELRGPLTQQQKELMRILLKQRRRKEWADIIGIKWMDGMPLTLEQIYTFYNDCGIDELKEILDDLTKKTYLRFEHPKQQIEQNGITFRKPDEKLPKGYNIVTGKLSFELNKIMDPKGSAPTIVATEADHIGVIDQGKIRKLSQRECLRLFGFPEDYTLDTLEMKDIYDLVGNTVVVSVVQYLAEQILSQKKEYPAVKFNPTSLEIYNHLIEIKHTLVGGIKIELGDTSVQVDRKDGVGDLIEEWLGKWIEENNYDCYSANKDGESQSFPDYYVGSENQLLEVKSFDREASPNFDIANFESYCKSLSENPERLYADYLIIGYELKKSKLTIKDVWLKKIWEISCPSARYPLKTQNKKKVIYNIRPATWYSRNTKFKVFNNQFEFVNALYKTQNIYRGFDYKKEFQKNMRKFLEEKRKN